PRAHPLALGPGREFDAIRDFAARWGSLASALGDDCAVLDVPAGARLCVSTDASVEDVHFRRGWLTPREIGYRAAAAALSDLAAAAAEPLGLLLALSAPHAWRADIGEVAEGVGEAARAAGTRILGGDTTGGAGALSLTVTVLGAARRPLSRGGAEPGDRVWVTGALGGPLAALRAFERGEAPAAADRERFARPVPRLREARWLAERGARAAIDVSDGLLADLGHVAAASEVTIEVDVARVPCLAGVSNADAAGSGEEYELAVVLPPALDVAEAFARELGTPLTEVGRVASSGRGPGRVIALASGTRVDLPVGYDHFSS
ncbi:MAG TPA: thiamine-phosphate kinase, partial [Gemmatimonadaceae bacterium]|nr:thiamine-phosphate kinase [Gemmatimonadaceae bacterium]